MNRVLPIILMAAVQQQLIFKQILPLIITFAILGNMQEKGKSY